MSDSGGQTKMRPVREFGDRYLHVLPVTRHPHGPWTTQRATTDQGAGPPHRSIRFLSAIGPVIHGRVRAVLAIWIVARLDGTPTTTRLSTPGPNQGTRLLEPAAPHQTQGRST